jgi:hypothetical protein
LSVREDFPSADRLSNDWALIGSPGVDDGLILDGTNYARRNLVGSEFCCNEVSIAAKFIPAFSASDNIEPRLIGNAEYQIFKTNNANFNTLRIRLGGTTIANVPFATYSQYWVEGGLNTLVVAGESGDTSAWLNGNLILDSAATVWSYSAQTSLYAGRYSLASTGFFLGTIKEVKVFKQKLTQQEAIDYHNNETYCWRSKAVVDLPMLRLQHDPNNTTGVELVTNGDFSNGTTGWNAASGASLSATDGTLDVMILSGDTAGQAFQNALTVGKTSLVSLQAAGDGGVGFPRVKLGNVVVYTGTTSASFDTVVLPGVPDDTELRLEVISNGSVDSSAFFRSVSVQETDARTLDVSGNGDHGTLGDGSTASTIPDKSETRGYRFDGVDDAITGLPALSGDYTVVFAEPNNVSVVNNDTLYNQIQTPGGFAGHLLELVAVPELLTPTQVFDAIYHARTQARII